MTPGDRAVRVAALLFGVVLRLHPRVFLEAFGDEVREAFEIEAREAYERAGGPGVVAYTVRACRDVVASRVRERRALAAEGVPGHPGVRTGSGGEGMMRGTTRDLWIGARMLARRPTYALVAIGTLALGIGATTAIFSVVHGVLMRPLPFPEPDRLVRVYHAEPGSGMDRGSFSLPDRDDWAERTSALDGIAAYTSLPSGPLLPGGEQAIEVRTAYVSAGFFETLGRDAWLGRPLADAEEHGDNRVVVLSHDFWQRRYGGDESIVGRTIPLDDAGYLVVGVMPPDFLFPTPDVEAWLFLTVIDPTSIPTHLREVRFLDAVGRLAPGVSMAQAGSELAGVATGLAETYPETNAELTGAALVALHESVTGGVRPTLLLTLAVVGLVLLIACANVANLMLSRGLERGREVAIRIALGAGRAQVVRQLLTESLLLAAAGGALGIALGVGGVRAIVSRSGDLIPRSAEIGVDGTVLAFAAGVTVLTALAFGLAPSLEVARRGASAAGSTRGAGRGGRSSTWGALVAAQVALAMVAVVSSGLLLRSARALQSVDVGLEPEGLVALSLTFNDARYPDQGSYMAVYRELTDHLEEMPGVRSVASVRYVPLRRDGESGSFSIPERPGLTGADRPEARIVQVSPGFFVTAGVPLLGGRDFTDRDDERSAPVVIVNDALRRRYWPGEDPVGRAIDFGRGAIEVVGLVGDVRQAGLAQDPVPTIYVSQYQNSRRGMAFLVRTDGGDAAALLPRVREAVRAVDPDQPIEELAEMTDVVYSAAAQPRFFSLLLSAFGLLALSLSSFGIYGVVARSVNRRVSEIGIRVALGASAHGVVGMIVWAGMRPVLVGGALGLAGAAVVTRTMRGVLFGVSSADPATFVAVPLLLLGVAALACWVPAKRAVRVDPTEALRAE